MNENDEKECKKEKKKYKRKKCEHNKQKYACWECGGKGICEHLKRKDICATCGGKGICEHRKIKYDCIDCGGNRICEHRKRKDRCVDCNGNQICEHRKRRNRCVDCNGSQICEHRKMKCVCMTCNLPYYLIHLQRNSIKRLLNSTNIQTQSNIEYLGCTPQYFKNYIQSKFTDGMDFTNIQLDHIKPISKFNLEDPEEFLKCCHYTNLQPLFPNDNMLKANKWTEEDEKFWNENICYKEYFSLYF